MHTPHTHGHALHMLSNTFCYRKTARRSLSSEMNSTYGVWTNPKSLGAQQKCTRNGCLWWADTCLACECVCVCDVTTNACTPFIPNSHQLHTTNFVYSWRLSALSRIHTNKQQTGDTLTHAQNVFPSSFRFVYTFNVQRYSKINVELKCKMPCKIANGIRADVLRFPWYSSCIEFSHSVFAIAVRWLPEHRNTFPLPQLGIQMLEMLSKMVPFECSNNYYSFEESSGWAWAGPLGKCIYKRQSAIGIE